MGFWEFIIAIVFITTLGKVLGAAFSKGAAPPTGVPPSHAVPHGVAYGSAADRAYLEALAGEVRALRAEVEQMRAGRVAGAPVAAAGGALPRDVAERVNALTEEMHSLRDTTTQFDMTFDAALDRLERRLERVEEGQVAAAVAAGETDAAAQAQRWYAGTAGETPQQQQTVGQR